MQKHPTTLELEQLRRNEDNGTVGVHAASCSECQSDLDFLAALGNELGAPSPEIDIPEERDLAILALAHARGTEIATECTNRRWAQRSRALLLWAGPIAAAAGIALLVTQPFSSDDRIAAPPPQSVARGDFNRDGHVDIVDALLLARAVEDTQAVAADWDLNGDAQVDRADAEQIAHAAVALSGGAR